MKTVYAKGRYDLQKSLSFSHTPSFAAKSTFFYIQKLGYFLCGENYNTMREGFKSYLLIYTIKGKGYMNYDGKSYEVKKDNIVIIDCFKKQEYYTDKTELWEMQWMHFNGYGSEGYYKRIIESYGPVIGTCGTDAVLKNMELLMELKRVEDKQFDIKASSVIMLILTDILLTSGKNLSVEGEKPLNTQIEKVLVYLEENYKQNISLEDMAKAACLSPYHFIRVFKRLTGYSPYEYLIKYRINQAKVQLSSQNTSIEQIAENVGFESTSNFIRTFRRLEEITPLKYRKFWSS